MKTTNVCNSGIAHLSFRVGGAPFCKTSRGHIVVTDDNRMGYAICRRCEAKLAKMREASARQQARADKLQMVAA